MATFTPPVDQANDTTSLEADPLANRLFRHYEPIYAGRNVFILTDGTTTEEWPPATYNSDGSLALMPEERVSAAFYGGHGAYTVTSAQATILTNAGYAVV